MVHAEHEHDTITQNNKDISERDH